MAFIVNHEVRMGDSHTLSFRSGIFKMAAALTCSIALVAVVVSQAAPMPQSRDERLKMHPLLTVFQDDTYQLTGVTVSRTGRIFVNYPRWSDKHLNALVEVLPGGSVKPYPDESWNRWDNKSETAGKHFVCVQSVVVDDTDTLWVVDPAAPMMGPVVRGGPKLVQIDLKTNTVQRVLPFGPEVAPEKSYLNDVRVDTKRKTAYLTDSGMGAIIVVDLASGKAHRALDGHPSVKAEPDVKIEIDGKPVVDDQGKTPMINSDGIALSPDGEYLYYQALTSQSLYRVKTDALRDAANPANAASAVEKVATTFPADGIWMDAEWRLYLSDLKDNAVVRLMPQKNAKTKELLVTDPRLQWPDTFSEGPDGMIYITASHINESPRFNKGRSARSSTYGVFKFKP
jgi:sugar lactone lactonase YvrE